MTNRRQFLSLAAIGASAATLLGLRSRPAAAAEKFEYQLSDAAWRKKLSPAAYRTLRHEDTEYPGTSALNTEKRAGLYSCAGCDLPLYSSRAKYDSGTGWPSFWLPLKNAVATKTDYTLGLPRVEVHCRRCGGHLGHVFDDGPRPTGKRYCMNGVAMKFTPGKAV
ncbi:MAG: peptide-methionine (R)-S-oxide reductase MsrB [Sphingomonas sp.]|uniref:peptide-methionine (R)-S-oxide reductase MsrB n=1 Tax=Sphingomonas sp. TaxID=28214 RepID=UPI000DB7CB1C|nr:peptide-methionine (R)-S-oxide reductase [Zymomonas sp.]MBA4772634.1 peptide-methionine (R)-S-oxide reductase MsrB [Sphingomonas sp.]PZP20055.1 MAG: peptide-methionine (R)-S-oxide reductase [Sphingomonas hengshuiensis]